MKNVTCGWKSASRAWFLAAWATTAALLFGVTPTGVNAQTEGQGAGRCVILGKVVDATTNDPLPFASVVLQGASSGTATDLDGNYRLEGVTAGVHNVVFRSWDTRP